MLSGPTRLTTAITLLRGHAERDPRKQAIAAPGRPLSTFPELLASVDDLSGILRRFGAGHQSRIAILSTDALVTATAVLMASEVGTAFPIDPRLVGPELEACLLRTAPQFLVCDVRTPDSLAEIGRNSGACVLRFDHAHDAPAGRLHLLDAISARARERPFLDACGSAVVLPTSGTTAAPRCVGWTSDMIVHAAAHVIEALSLSDQDRCLGIMPLFHGHGLVACLFAPLLSGGSVILPAGFDAGAFRDWLDEFTPTWWSAAPSIHRAILSHGSGISPPPELRLIRSASAALPEPWRQQIEDTFGVPVIEALGLTEATHQVASNRIDVRACKPGSVGRPFGVDIFIRAEDGRPAGAGEPGELFIHGRTVITRYLDEEVSDAFDDGWLRTGDVVCRDDDGDLFVIGRTKELIERSGESVSPYEVESALLSHPAIDQIAVFGRPHDELGETVAAAYVARLGYAPAPADIRAFAAERLAAFKVPTTITACATLPFDTRGKLRRFELAKQIPAPQNIEAGCVADAQLLERVHAIWRQVLCLPEAGQNATFFEMGGESLAALRLLACVRERFGVDVSLPEFFASPTIAGLAGLITADTAVEIDGSAPLSSIVASDPAGKFHPFPLTELQQAYWVGRSSDLALGGMSCNSYSEYDLIGIDVTRLEAAWARLVQRHEALRLFILDGDRQVVREEVPRPEMLIEDLRRLASEERDAALERKRARMSQQARAAEDWPLYDVSISLLDDVRSRLHVSFDGLILDAASRDQLMAEWSVLYRDPIAVLQDAALTVRDLVLDEKRRLSAREGRDATTYWHARLADLPGSPDLPGPPDPPANQRGASNAHPHFQRASCEIEYEIWQQFRSRARRAGLTPIATVLTAFAETVATWSASDRFVLNVPVTGRPAGGGGDRVIGPLASSILLEIDFSTSNTFVGRARKIQEQLQRDLQHRIFGSVRIARSVRSSRGVAPVFPVVFTAIPARTEDGLFTTETFGVSQTPQVTLDVHVQEMCDRLAVNWNWVPSAFVDGLGETMLSAFCGLLQRLSAEEGIWHVLAPFREPLTPVARLDDAEPECPVSEDTLYEIVRRQAAARPRAPALITGQRTWTFAELLEAAQAYAATVEDACVPYKHPVAIILTEREKVPIAVLGILQAGRSFVCIEPSLPAQRIKSILRQADARLVLSDTASHHGRFDLAGCQIHDVRQSFFHDGEKCRFYQKACGLEPDDVASIVFTSGTTGSPKGCPFTHRSVLRAVRAINRRLRVSNSDRAIAVTSFDHDMALYDLFGLWDAGGSVIIANSDERNDPRSILALIESHGATLWCSVPALLDVVLDRAAGSQLGGLQQLRAVIIGGDRIAPSLPRRLWQEAGSARFISVGGPTETTIWSVVHEVVRGEFQGGSIPYGHPLAGASYTILGPCLERKPVWAIGEMACSGPGVIAGYWRSKEETLTRFRRLPQTQERVFLTGDLGRITGDGILEIIGRNDRQIKIDGERIELGEIDTALLDAPGINAAASVAVRGEGRPPRIVSFVVSSTGTNLDPRGLRGLISRRLPRAALPSDIIAVDALPLTARGKLDHTALEKQARDRTVEKEDRSPRGQHSTIESISKIVYKVLATTDGRFNWKQDLVSIGATSVDVIRILNRIDQRFGVRPSVDDVFANMSIAGIAALVDSALSACCPCPPPAAPAPNIEDPDERERFRQAAAERRTSFVTSCSAIVSLEPPAHDAHARLRARRSERSFAIETMSFTDFSGLLGLLSVCDDGRRRYASSGGLYALDTFIFVRPGRVTGLPGGTYFYDPNEHQLAAIEIGAELDAFAYDRLKNRPLFTAAAFALYLVAEEEAIAPLYGLRAGDLLLLDAGYIGQLLQSSAPEFGIGLCPIGSLDFDRVRPSFGLSERRRLIHSLVGGALPMRAGVDHKP